MSGVPRRIFSEVHCAAPQSLLLMEQLCLVARKHDPLTSVEKCKYDCIST
jgi:hypothetical protein